MTLLKAHQRCDQFRGSSGREQAAWMRKILTNTLIDAVRKRGPLAQPLERSLEAVIEESSCRLEALIESSGQQGDRQDMMTALAVALAQLPEDQRLAIELRYLQGLSIVEMSRRMERSAGSVGGLLQRGLRRLREDLRDE